MCPFHNALTCRRQRSALECTGHPAANGRKRCEAPGSVLFQPFELFHQVRMGLMVSPECISCNAVLYSEAYTCPVSTRKYHRGVRNAGAHLIQLRHLLERQLSSAVILDQFWDKLGRQAIALAAADDPCPVHHVLTDVEGQREFRRVVRSTNEHERAADGQRGKTGFYQGQVARCWNLVSQPSSSNRE